MRAGTHLGKSVTTCDCGWPYLNGSAGPVTSLADIICTPTVGRIRLTLGTSVGCPSGHPIEENTARHRSRRKPRRGAAIAELTVSAHSPAVHPGSGGHPTAVPPPRGHVAITTSAAHPNRFVAVRPRRALAQFAVTVPTPAPGHGRQTSPRRWPAARLRTARAPYRTLATRRLALDMAVAGHSCSTWPPQGVASKYRKTAPLAGPGNGKIMEGKIMEGKIPDDFAVSAG
jgi:hypothetical protein